MILYATITFTVISAYVYYICYNRRKLPLPPGPPKLPVIGNIFDLPRGFEWLTFTEWGKKYSSDIIHAQAAGVNIIILNSADAATDLLEKRWRLYSDRPSAPMPMDLMGWNWMFPMMSYGDKFRSRRKLLQDHFPPFKRTSVYQPKVVDFVHVLLQQLYESPEEFMRHGRRAVSGVLLSLAYGLDIKKTEDPFVTLAEEAISTLADASVPGTFLVDFIPALKYIPEWFPGAGFKRKANQWKKIALAARDVPFETGETRIHKGLGMDHSFLSLSLDSIDHSQDVSFQRNLIKDVAAVFFVAGSDTTLSAFDSFILSMLCYPDVQRKAQQELDRVLDGCSRLPTFQDEQSLPYLSAVLKEVLRTRPPAPIAIPHTSAVDDVYRGYHIPAASVVIANIWSMLNNENDYPNTSKFSPERFLRNESELNGDVRDPATVVFGFGRRICPGAHIGLSMVWLSAASILALFNITPITDDQGNEIYPSMEYHSSIVYHPLPFQCKITPRSETARNILSSFSSGI